MKKKSTKKTDRNSKVQFLVLMLLTALLVPLIAVPAQENEPSRPSPGSSGDSTRLGGELPDRQPLPADVRAALDRLPADAKVASLGPDRLPTLLAADRFGSVPANDLSTGVGERLNSALRTTVLAELAAVFRLTPDELRLRSVRQAGDETGDRKGIPTATVALYRQYRNNLEVIGGDFAVVLDAKGAVRSVSSTARGGQDAPTVPEIDEATARSAALAYAIDYHPAATIEPADDARLLYVLASSDYRLHLAYALRVAGTAAEGPFADVIYIDASTGGVADVHPEIQPALNRQIYTSNYTTNLPGAARRFEGQAANADALVNTNYNYLGVSYNWYRSLFNRDSFNNQGAAITSSLHYSTNYVNAFWNTQQLVFGDGDNRQSGPLANALDVTAHELTHAVTQYTSGLFYQNESGALNEAWSDIFGAVIEARERLGATGYNANTWKVGEDVWTPATAGDALRYMDDPVRDGSSKDYYPLRYLGANDNGGVHTNSGIANLAFKLTVTGGGHPRGRNAVQVAGIGIDKARQIYYRAGALYLVSNSTFEQARAATAQAAQDLYGRCNAEYVAVERAWDVVAVPGTWRCGGGGGGDIHYSTYGGALYDWHGGGCYDVAQSSNPATSSLRLQMDAIPWVANPATAIARRAAFTFPDTSRPYTIILNMTAPYLQVNAPSGGNADSRYTVTGDVNQSATIRFYQNGGAGQSLGTIVILRRDNGVFEYSAKYANGSDLRAFITPNVVVDANLQPGWNVAVRGLAGVYPNEADLRSRGGQAYSAATLRGDVGALNQFASSWACPSGESLFEAPAPPRAQTAFPVIDPATRPTAEQRCETAGLPRFAGDRFENCVFDAATGGDEYGPLMATHAGAVWTFESQPPPAPEPDPCVSPTEPTPTEPTPTEPMPTTGAAVSGTRRTAATGKAIICSATPETETTMQVERLNRVLRDLFGDAPAGGDPGALFGKEQRVPELRLPR